MVNLEVLFQQVKEGVLTDNPRYEVLDSQHIMDKDLGIEYHIYSDYKNKPYRITKGEDELLTGVQMTENEAGILMQLGGNLAKHFADKQREKLYQLVYKIPAPANGTEVPLSRRL